MASALTGRTRGLDWYWTQKAISTVRGQTGHGRNYNCPIVGMYGCGVVFELSPPGSHGGTWTETVLYNFCSVFSGTNCLDGYSPQAPLVFDPQGNLYGASDGGGGHARGARVVAWFSSSPRR